VVVGSTRQNVGLEGHEDQSELAPGELDLPSQVVQEGGGEGDEDLIDTARGK
jgi:hypothetical protein